MLARILSCVIPVTTFFLLLLGSVVHTTGASLACPDWPLCYGQLLPPMQGGILLEHSHRLLASGVGLVTLMLAITALRQPDRRLTVSALAGLLLVMMQGLLGGLTVVYRLPAIISIAHLSCSMLFFAWSLGIFFQVRASQAARAGGALSTQRPVDAAALRLRRPVAWAAAGILLQIILGAFVRHSRSSLSCGLEVFTCGGALLPVNAMQWVQTIHRLGAILLGGWAIVATLPVLRWARAARQWGIYRLGLACHLAVLGQWVVGALTLKTAVHLHVVTLHLALAVILWGSLCAQVLALGPWGLGRRRPVTLAEAALGGAQIRGLHGAC